jgi:hypothetical protein
VADGLRWSPYLDEYLAHISHHSPVPQDNILVRQVKMQLIINQVRNTFGQTSDMEIPAGWMDILQTQLGELTSAADGNSLAFGNECECFGLSG